MIQRVNVSTENDPFSDNYIDVEVGEKTKILSNESYVKDLYALYIGIDEETTNISNNINNTITKGMITNIINNHAIVQLNEKYSTTIDLGREKKEYLEYFRPNVILDLKVKKINNNYNVSFSDAVTDLKYKEILNSVGKKVAYYAKVEQLVHGGYYLDIDGIKVFMPGSLGGMNKLDNFEELLGKFIYVVPVNFSNQFNMIVVSYRDYLQSLKPMELDNIKYDIEYKGKVTGISKFGIFVEFNSESNIDKPFILTGLIPISEMDTKVKLSFDNKEYKAGSIIDFYVKNIVTENKIILTKFYIDWEETFKNYKQDMIVNCTVIKTQDNIVFVTINNTKLIGTITNYNKELVVDELITLVISKIDVVSKKIFLKKPIA